MEEITAKVSDHLSDAIETIDNGILDVLANLVLEEQNLAELVRPDSTNTQEHLHRLKEMVDGLRERVIDLRGQLATTQGLVGEEPGPIPEQFVSEGENGTDGKADLTAKEAATQRHDEPVTLGGILRSLLMANEPAQRQNKDDFS